MSEKMKILIARLVAEQRRRPRSRDRLFEHDDPSEFVKLRWNLWALTANIELEITGQSQESINTERLHTGR